jgi:hypothetical protein
VELQGAPTGASCGLFGNPRRAALRYRLGCALRLAIVFAWAAINTDAALGAIGDAAELDRRPIVGRNHAGTPEFCDQGAGIPAIAPA